MNAREGSGGATRPTRPGDPAPDASEPGFGPGGRWYGHPRGYGPRPWRLRFDESGPGPFAARPSWWPPGEPWPPRRRRGTRRPQAVLWRIGCLIFALAIVATMAAGIGVWTAALALGAVSAPAGALAGAAVAFLLSTVFLAALARGIRATGRQLGALVRAAERVEEGDFSVRLDEPRSRELAGVARAFNAMAAKLEATEERRRTFLAELAHELRTPVAVVRGQLEALRDGVYPPDPAHIDPALAQARTLERLVEDVRTLGLAEAGGIPLAREPVEPAILVNGTLSGFRPRALDAGIDLRAELPADVPTISVDPARIGGVLSNLVGNALDHTPNGGRVLVVARVEGPWLAIEVRDTGSGFPPDLLPRAFDRFIKGPGSSGSGLGLAIARDVVAAHGGTIAAANVPEGGAVVRFTVPVEID